MGFNGVYIVYTGFRDAAVKDLYDSHCFLFSHMILGKRGICIIGVTGSFCCEYIKALSTKAGGNFLLRSSHLKASNRSTSDLSHYHVLETVKSEL